MACVVASAAALMILDGSRHAMAFLCPRNDLDDGAEDRVVADLERVTSKMMQLRLKMCSPMGEHVGPPRSGADVWADGDYRPGFRTAGRPSRPRFRVFCPVIPMGLAPKPARDIRTPPPVFRGLLPAVRVPRRGSPRGHGVFVPAPA